MRDILNLAYLRIVRNVKNSLLFFTVLLLSFASAIVSVSVVGSISKTNAEFRLNTYGTWYFGIPYGFESDKDKLFEKDWVDGIGTAQSIGTLSAPSAPGKIIGIGTMDEALINIGRICLDQGAFPTNDNEIAMEMDSLSALGYDYTLGQEITVTVIIPLNTTADDIDFLPIMKTYTLCGIIHEYTDLWYFQPNKNNIPLNSAFISNTAAAGLLAESEEMLAEAESVGVGVRKPVCQYFLCVSEENRDEAKEDLSSYLSESDYSIRDQVPCVNTVAYTDKSVADYDDFYMYIIAVLTFISILCLEIIRLPANTHSFSVLRSVGMSKGQLALMQILEALLMGIPAILLGIPVSVLLTRLALRLMLYSGSVDIQVCIPYEALLFILGLWLAAIVLSRLVIYVFTLRVPMIGRLQMSTAKAKRTKIVRSGFIVLLLSVFSAGVISSGMNSLSPEYDRQLFSDFPSYRLMGSIIKENTLSKSDMDVIKEIPGLSEVYGFSEMYVGLSFDELSEEDVYLLGDCFWMPYGMVYLLVIDENDWTSILDFGGDTEAFHNGELVFVSVPDDGNEYPLPEKEAVLSVYSYTEQTANSWRGGNIDDANKCELMDSLTVSTQIMRIPENSQYRTLASVGTTYTVICSERFFGNLLNSLPKGESWGRFTIGDEFAYEHIYATASLSSDDFSTDIVMAKICKERKIVLVNNRQENLANVQENVQTLIMLYFSGACVCIIAIIILWSNVSLETKDEKHSFYIRRCIGMSKRQIDLNIFGKSLLRCITAFLIGWLPYITDKFLYHFGQCDSLISVLKKVIWNIKFDFTYYENQGVYAAVFLLGLVLPLVLILYAKRELRKDGDAK